LSFPCLSLKHFHQPKFYVETRKEYLHGIKERNVLDTVLSRLVSLPWFLVTLDVKFSCRVTIPKAKEAELHKTTLHTHQHTSHLQISTDVPPVNITLNCL
jgi:hypothetical protein